MTDLAHTMGGDLSLSATGDLAFVDGAHLTLQRVERRLLTNPGGYIWHITYGAGLARFVGEPAPAQRIAAITRRQMRLERGVGPSPVPVVDVTANDIGTVSLTVRYADRAGTVIQQNVRP